MNKEKERREVQRDALSVLQSILSPDTPQMCIRDREKTDFVKLLCRKHNPYDPRKRQEIRKGRRTDSSPVFFSGSRAKEEAKKLVAGGEEIVHITVEEALAYHEAVRMNVKPENIILTAKERKDVYKRQPP